MANKIGFIEEYINKLLVVPYNNIFGLSKELLELLTEKEFFTECFVHASDGIVENMHNADKPVKTAFEIDLPTQELIDRAERIRTDEKSFLDWLDSQQDNVYYVLGDAGTGKSVYLHWLKYFAKKKASKKDWRIQIVDLAESTDKVKILDTSVTIPDFAQIYYKVISAIIKSIDILFYPEKVRRKKIDHNKAAERYKKTYLAFKNCFLPSYPLQNVSEFFDNFSISACENTNTNKHISETCGRSMADWFSKVINTCGKRDALELILQAYLYVLRCLKPRTIHVIAIDNVERIIGDDEIFNADLTEFASTLRHIQTAIIRNNERLVQKYKLVVFMRNTSVRMLTPQQITDIRPSMHDMSDWFDVETIICKKLTWYANHGAKLELTDELLSILNDNINDGGKLRGLYTKISMIFNNNKRVIVHFLVNILCKESNQSYIELYNKLREHKVEGLSNELSQFAARSIIYRLLLNEMRQDDFFQSIMTERVSKKNVMDGNANNHNNEKVPRVKSFGAVALGYARRILTSTYEYRLIHIDDSYMPLQDILCDIFGVTRNSFNQFYDPQNALAREQIASILFAMNYYDGRKGDWLQFIDIQYGPDNVNKSTRIPKAGEMLQVLEKGVNNIKVKITTAGIAYLFFIAFSYEYFACKSINTDTCKEIIGEYDIPPLICTIPTKEQIMKTKLANMDCIKTIQVVLIETLRCITKMNHDEALGIAMFPFRKALQDLPIKHAQRITNSHVGYIDNYVACLSEIHYQDAQNDRAFKKHLSILVDTIQEMRDYYRSYATFDMDIYKSQLQILIARKQQAKDRINDN